jgi:hypothetical protein
MFKMIENDAGMNNPHYWELITSAIALLGRP